MIDPFLILGHILTTEEVFFNAGKEAALHINPLLTVVLSLLLIKKVPPSRLGSSLHVQTEFVVYVLRWPCNLLYIGRTIPSYENRRTP